MSLKQYAILACSLFFAVSAGATNILVNVNTTNICINNTSTDVLYSFNYDYLGSNTSAIIHFGDGTSSPVGNVTTYSLTGNHVYELPGIYTMRLDLMVNGVFAGSHQHTINTACAYVSLASFYDLNDNCIKDPNEAKLAGNTKVEIWCDGSFEKNVFTNNTYSYPVIKGKNYTFKLANNLFAPCQANGVRTVYISNNFKDTTIAFGLKCAAGAQFDLAATATARFRPVSTSFIYINTKNITCVAKTGQVTLTIDPRYVFKDANATPISSTGNSVTWNVKDLSITKTATIIVNVTPVTNAVIKPGDAILSAVNIGPLTGDFAPENNSYTDTTKVIASFDPNEKSVSPGGFITAGQKLTYTLNFENLGNDTAFDVVILDTLSNNLDMNSFGLTDGSHPVNAGIVDGDNSYKIARFEFRDIKLGDSADKLHNKGYAVFTINARESLTPSTVISNRAGIYFDINPVVMTNTVNNITAPLTIKETRQEDGVSVYPNPANDILHITTDKQHYRTAEVANNVGQVVIANKLDDGKNSISIKHLVPGVYQLILKGDNGVKTVKVVKE